MPEIIDRSGLRRHVPRRDRKRARPIHPVTATLLVVAGLALPFSLLLAITFLFRLLPDLMPYLIVGTTALILVGGSLVMTFLTSTRPH
ncbi:MAG: hypothetical protein JXM73_13905 [Anaerolineae bacterium]|nr:hypothetical protein [Anaerolineae bacterium]